MDHEQNEKTIPDLWKSFAEQQNLSPLQLEQFTTYATLLEEWAERINLTTILGTKNIIRNHFQDSLEIAQFISMQEINAIADVGSGGGFPGL